MQPMLSVCIPTYNRAEALFVALKSIVDQAAFKETSAIELVISDNASNDNTVEICRYFQQQFPLKIKFTTQVKNIGSTKNHEFVLRNASGAFRKLHNDNLVIRDGGLAEMIKVVDATQTDRPTLFFLNGSKSVADAVTVVNTVDQFIAYSSYHCTWIGGYGLWDSQLQRIDDLNRYAELQIPHTDVLLRCVRESTRTILINLPLFALLDIGPKKGYNIAEVFGKNYLFLLSQYRDTGLLAETTYEREKYSILVNHIIPFYFSTQHEFEQTGFFRHLAEYRNCDYFYQAIEKLICDLTKSQAKLENG